MPDRPKPPPRRRPTVGKRPAPAEEPIEKIDLPAERTVMELRVALGLPFAPPDESEAATPRPKVEEARAQADLAALPERLSEAFSGPLSASEEEDDAKTPPPKVGLGLGRGAVARAKRFVLRDVGTVDASGVKLPREIILACVFIALAVVYWMKRGEAMSPEKRVAAPLVHAPAVQHRPMSWTDTPIALKQVDIQARRPTNEPASSPPPSGGNPLRRRSFVEIPGREPEAEVTARSLITREVIEEPAPEPAQKKHRRSKRQKVEEARPDSAAAHARAAHAMLTVVSQPAGATVEIDGKTLGKTPLVRPAPLGKNAFSVRIRLGKHKPWTGTVAPDETGHFNLKVVLR